jgi:hypothetical protein
MLNRSIAFVFFIFFTFSACAADNDFDVVCGIFKELQNKPDLDKLSAQQRETFVTDRVTNTLDSSSDARVSWEAVVAAEPSQRYEIFQSGAQEVLGKSWSCKSMEDLAPSIGE